MNKELKDLKEAIDEFISTYNLVTSTGAKTTEIWLRVALEEFAKSYATSLQPQPQSQSQETAKQETFTARDARAATLHARTYEGFLRSVMKDIEYQTRRGLHTTIIATYYNDYRVKYFPRLIKFLHSMRYEVTKREYPEIYRDNMIKRIRLSIYW